MALLSERKLLRLVRSCAICWLFCHYVIQQQAYDVFWKICKQGINFVTCCSLCPSLPNAMICPTEWPTLGTLNFLKIKVIESCRGWLESSGSQRSIAHKNAVGFKGGCRSPPSTLSWNHCPQPISVWVQAVAWHEWDEWICLTTRFFSAGNTRGQSSF